MNIYTALATAITLAGASLSAHAASVAAGGVYGGPQQKYAYCYVFNVGKPVTLTRADIIDQNGNVLGTSGNCNVQILSRRTCQVAANIASNLTYGCRVIVADQAAPNLRGTLDFRDANQNVLVSAPLR